MSSNSDLEASESFASQNLNICRVQSVHRCIDLSPLSFGHALQRPFGQHGAEHGGAQRADEGRLGGRLALHPVAPWPQGVPGLRGPLSGPPPRPRLGDVSPQPLHARPDRLLQGHHRGGERRQRPPRAICQRHRRPRASVSLPSPPCRPLFVIISAIYGVQSRKENIAETIIKKSVKQ
eukprot:scaffold6173_cov46-Prasinocladus_malaysianus.AAC.6